ncbi:MAG: PIN domain-containing protein [Patescibacteria group bacterium]
MHGGVPEQAIDYCLENYEIVLSSLLLEEIMDKLKRKAKAPHRWLRIIRQRFDDLCEIVTTTTPESPITRDPNDEHVVIAAKLTNCKLIISGDKDLLELGSYKGIQIISSRQFMDQVL